mmetsp:Transcript_36604/g.66155  ORF Transcript_36604/g.66155 Transcript_36604/m.66155 type:complete len:242 (+) Transcript_36604:187-912(+)
MFSSLAVLLQDEIIGAEIHLRFVEAPCHEVLLVGVREALQHGELGFPAWNVALGLLDRGEEVHVAEWEGLRPVLRHEALDALRVIVHNLGLWESSCCSTELRHAVKGDKLLARNVVDLAIDGRIADALRHEVGQVLAMPELSDVCPVKGHTHRSSTGHPVKEVALYRIVVQGTINVDWADRRPVQTLCFQVVFTLELFLVTRVWVARVLLGERQDISGSVNTSTAHENELLTATTSLDGLS